MTPVSVLYFCIMKNKTLTILGDLFGMAVSLLYVVYISVLLILGVGVLWMNLVILILTVLYLGFFVVKIFYLNSRTSRVGKPAKKIFKYTKYFVRLINAAIIVISFINLGSVDRGDILKIISIIFLLIMLVISITIDIAVFLIKRKLRQRKERKADNGVT